MARLRLILIGAINFGLMVFVVLIIASALGGCAIEQPAAADRQGVLEERPVYIKGKKNPRCQHGFISYCTQHGPEMACSCIDKERMQNVFP